MARSATAPQNNLLPRPLGGQGAGMVVSLGVHAALLAALAGVVQWRTQTPYAVSAELWAAVPETAAPPAPTPAPAPEPSAPAPAPPRAAEPPRPPPDIATEREQRQRAERERLERERTERERAAAAERQERQRREQAERQAREEQQRLEQQRQDNLRRMMSQAGSAAGTSPGSASRDAAPSANYLARIAALIRDQANYAGEVPGNRPAEVEVRLAASGTIISRRLIKSSGHPAWDDAVLRAIDKAARLPADSDGRVPPSLIIAFRRNE